MVTELTTLISINNITFKATTDVIELLTQIHLRNLSTAITLIDYKIKHLEETIEAQLTYASTNEDISSLRHSNEFELAKYKQLKIEIQEFQELFKDII